MVLIIMQAVMLEKALYKIPKSMGWFDNTEDEIYLAESFKQPSEVKAINDDDYEPAKWTQLVLFCSTSSIIN